MPSPILQIRNSVSHMNACINFSILGKVDIHEQLEILSYDGQCKIERCSVFSIKK